MKLKLCSFNKFCSMFINKKSIFLFNSEEYHSSTGSPSGSPSSSLSFPVIIQRTYAGISAELFTHGKLEPTQLFVFNSWNNFKLLNYLAWKNKGFYR